MPNIRLTPEAEEDLLNIWEWGAERYGFDRADKFIDELEAAFERIASMPLAATARPQLGKGIRSRPFGNYVIFYKPEKEGILVVHVYRGSRNTKSLFFGE